MQTNIPIAKQPFTTASKRKKDSCSSDDQFLLQELSSLPQKLSNIESLIKTDCSCNTETSNKLIVAVDNLSKLISDKLDTIILLLSKPSKVTNECLTSIPKQQTNTVLEKLRDLKNARSSSVYKLSYNNTHREIYSNGLLQTPQLVPRKLHEIVNFRDNNDVQELKKKRTVRRVEDEIETLSYHAKIHESKIASIDMKANDILKNISDCDERTRVSCKWRQLVSFGQESIENKWEQKRIFLQSDKHLIALGSKQLATSSFYSNESPQQRNHHSQFISNEPLKLPRQHYETQSREEHATLTPQDVDMDSGWTTVQHSKNWQRQQRSPRLNQQH